MMQSNLTFHDFKPAMASLHEAVLAGLSREPKSIDPKFLYDRRGSKLFDQICEQPEYYPTAVERDMLSRIAVEVAEWTGQNRTLIEPGAGNAAKVRLLLDALRPSTYIPIDISYEYLRTAAGKLAEEFPWLTVHAVCADYTRSLPVPYISPDGPRLVFFPGSSIGNFEYTDAGRFLAMVRGTTGDDGMLLIGVDTKKDVSVLNAAYNDDAGITARFNLNLLHRLRNELGIECDPDKFYHKAFYNPGSGRVEMHLVSKQKQTLRVNGRSFNLEAGESLHTENSYKYSPREFIRLASAAKFRLIRYWLDEDKLFAIYLFAAA
jgi:dimethylhistidine N-methyltransferase